MDVNWGVFGAGGIAARRTIPEGITRAGNAKLVAVMDVDEGKAKEVAQKYGARCYLQEEDLLKDKEVQAIYIATPVHLHCRQTVLAVEAGKHVLCEKPMALTLPECEQMMDVARRNKVKLAIGFMMRFHAYNRKAKEMVKEGLLGRIVFARAQLSCWYPPIVGAWRQDPKRGGGGSLMDLGNHCLDLLEFILESRAKEVSCFTGNLVQEYRAEDAATTLVRFENGAHGVVDSYFNIPDASSKNILEVYGSRGSILARGTIGQTPGGEMTVYRQTEEKGYEAQQGRSISVEEKIEPAPINTYQAEIESFSRCIEKDSEPGISAADGLWSQKVMLACYQSARSGRAVEL